MYAFYWCLFLSFFILLFVLGMKILSARSNFQHGSSQIFQRSNPVFKTEPLLFRRHIRKEMWTLAPGKVSPQELTRNLVLIFSTDDAPSTVQSVLALFSWLTLICDQEYSPDLSRCRFHGLHFARRTINCVEDGRQIHGFHW